MAEDDRTRQLHQEPPELADQIAQRRRHLLGSILPAGGKPVAVFEVFALDDELGELPVAREGALRRATQENRRGRGAEDTGELFPEKVEQRRGGSPGGGDVASGPAVPRSAFCKRHG